MRKYEIDRAKIHLSRLLDEAMIGEKIVITRNGRPLVRLVPIKPAATGKRRFIGSFKGAIKIHDDFDAPMPRALARAFGTDE